MTSVTPYLTVHDADAALRFYTQAFGATETMRMTGQDGKVGHAEFTIGDATFYLSDEAPELGAVSPRRVGGSTTAFVVTVQDADATYAQAVEAGATADRPVTDTPYGSRGGWLSDPFGHRWNVQTVTEDVSVEQLRERVGDSYDVR